MKPKRRDGDKLIMVKVSVNELAALRFVIASAAGYFGKYDSYLKLAVGALNRVKSPKGGK